QEDSSWTALTYDTIFGRKVSGTVFLRVNPYSTTGVDISAQLEPGRTFLLAALAQTAPSSGLTLTAIRPAQMVQDADETLSSFVELTDITDQPDYLKSAEGQAWRKLADTLAIIDKSFQVVATSDIESMIPFHMKQTWLTSGSFEPRENTC